MTGSIRPIPAAGDACPQKWQAYVSFTLNRGRQSRKPATKPSSSTGAIAGPREAEIRPSTRELTTSHQHPRKVPSTLDHGRATATSA
jgi:hypothetical protein